LPKTYYVGKDEQMKPLKIWIYLLLAVTGFANCTYAEAQGLDEGSIRIRGEK